MPIPMAGLSAENGNTVNSYQYCVLVTDKELGGTTAYGPYRTLDKARQVAGLFVDPHAAQYYDPEKYTVTPAALNKAE